MLKRRPPQFSERMFEFAYNAEFCRSNFSWLAAAPYIPSQRMERLQAYDVVLRVKKGVPVSSVFLQHKVATRYWVPVGQKTSSYYSAALGPRYYRFGLDNRQYNRIIFLRTKKSLPIFYCAPKFVAESRLNSYFLAGQIQSRSIWIDVAGAGRLVGANFHQSHSIGYTASETKVLRFSRESERLKSIGADTRGEEGLVHKFDEEYLNRLVSAFRQSVAEIDPEDGDSRELSNPIPTKFDELVEEVSFWAAKVLRVTWLVKPVQVTA